MGSLGNPNRFGPYGCAKPICTIYCPQWCYFMFPPQPPPLPFFSNPATSSDLNSSRPLIIIAVIGILASILLLMTTFYIIISKCCTNNILTTEFDDQAITEQELAAASSSSSSSGLDEVSIKLIRVCKYTKDDVRDCSCSVCLSEFQEGDSLRLLPRCDHAFHMPCIDTWLVSHSNCPLCRADVVIAADDNVNVIKPVSLLPV